MHNSDSGTTTVREIHIPEVLIKLWTREAGEQIICQIEFFAYLAARFEYKGKMENRAVIAWIDNESARYAASKGSASSISLMAMARVIQFLEAKSPSITWIERVCSFSNPADKPSRNQCKEAALLFNAMHDTNPIQLQEKVILAIQELTKDPYAVVNLDGII